MQQMEQMAAAMAGVGGGAANSPWLPGGPAAGAAAVQTGFHMSSVLMWEVMSLVMMRSVLTTAVGAMSNQMTSMAQQVKMALAGA